MFIYAGDKIKSTETLAQEKRFKGKEYHMKIDKELYHPAHPQHRRLKIEYCEAPFKCDGCKEAGIGLKYKCQQCDFDLHKACAVAPPSFVHPFYPKCEFEFHYQPPGPERRRCDACQKDVLGFTYHCKRCDFDLHPCCANLPRVLDDGEKNIYLCLKLAYPCHHCGRKGSGWSYKSECKTYNLHVSCVKELLLESWQATYFNVDKNKLRNLQTSIPSLKGASRRGGNMSRMAGVAIRAIASAVLGDPSAILAAAIGAFIPR